MSSIFDWSTTPANNATADANINWQEGQAPSTVNNSARVMMERVKEFISDIGGVNTVAGTANSITVTATSPFSAYSDGMRLTFKAANSITGASTLNANAIGSKAIRKFNSIGEVDTVIGDIVQGKAYDVIYFSALNSAAGGWLLVNPSSGWEPVGNYSISAVASLSITGLSAFRTIRVNGFITPSVAAAMLVQTSTNNGVSYDSAGTDYSYQTMIASGAAVSAASGNTGGALITSNSTNVISFETLIWNFNQSTSAFFSTRAYHQIGASLFSENNGSQRNNTTARNALRVIGGGGPTLTGYVVVEGVRG